MDSNFQVKISANISDLQRSIKDAQATLAQLKQSTDGVSSSMKNMEQNTNRGRLVAFAFGQVVRDAGFFSQSFSLGILAISNNIPILIDQLALSIKVLQPFAGALSLVGSLLTAGLTIWAYSTSAVKKYKDTLLDSQAAAMANAAELRSLLSIARDESLSIDQRQDAINRLNDGYQGYNNQLSIANVNSKKNIKRSEDMATVMLLEAEAAAIAAQAQAIYAKSLKLRNAPAEELGGFLETLGYSISKLGKVQFDISKPWENVLKASTLIKGNLFSIFNTGFGIYKNFSRARQEVADINEQAKNNELSKLDNDAKGLEDRLRQINLEITSKLLKPGGGKAKDSILGALSETLTAIDLDPSLTVLDKVREKINANQSALKSLIDEGLLETNPAVKSVIASLSQLSNQYNKLKQDEEDLKEAEKKRQEVLKEQQRLLDNILNTGEQLKMRRLDIANTLGLKDSAKIKQDIEAISDAILKFQQLAELNPAIAEFSGLNLIIGVLRKELEALGVQFKAAVSVEQEVQRANEWVQYLAQTVGGDLVNAFNEMMTTGKFSFEEIGRSLLNMIKKLAAAALAAAVLSAILSSLFGKSNKTGFQNIFGIISGINLSAGTTAVAPVAGAMTTTGINTSMTNSAAMATTSQPVLETRVSGNDLVILLDRATNNRNKYF